MRLEQLLGWQGHIKCGYSTNIKKSKVHRKAHRRQHREKKRIAITMFGVTTPCVDAMRHHLTTVYDHEVYVFHATGHVGRAMERLISSKGIDAIIDLTTTEVADEIVGGVMSAGPVRLEAAAKAGIPQVISVGACDMVNYGPRNTLPERFVKAGRNIYEHNASVTLVRTNVEECRQIGRFIAQKLKGHSARPGDVQVVLPVGGISLTSKPVMHSQTETQMTLCLQLLRKDSKAVSLR